MVQVTVGNNLKQNKVLVDANTTLRKVLEDAGINTSIGMTSLNGAYLKNAEFDKTFADFGVTEQCRLINVAKGDNAMA